MPNEIAYVTMDASPERGFNVKSVIVPVDEKPKTLWVQKGHSAGYQTKIDKKTIGVVRNAALMGNDSIDSIRRDGYCLVEDLQPFKQKMYESMLDAIQQMLEIGVQMQDAIRYSCKATNEGLVITTPVSTTEGVE